MDTQMKLMWHFIQIDDDGQPRLGYTDGKTRERLGAVVAIGETLRTEEPIVICASGYHASTTVWQALGYAPNRTALCRVRLGGTVIDDDDKSVAADRTIVAMLTPEATEKLLRDWTRWCASRVIHLWDAPDVVRQCLETGDESLLAASRAAAWFASWAASRAAAWVAAIEEYAGELEKRALAAIELVDMRQGGE